MDYTESDANRVRVHTPGCCRQGAVLYQAELRQWRHTAKGIEEQCSDHVYYEQTKEYIVRNHPAIRS